MSPTSRAARLPSPGRVGVLAAFLLAAGVVALAAQPPKEVEDPKAKPLKKVPVEDEDPKAKAKKKVVVEDPDPKPPAKVEAGPGNTPDVRLDELVRAADALGHPALKALCVKFAVPFDQLSDTKGNTLRIRPVGPCWRDGYPVDQAVRVNELGPDNQQRPERAIPVKDIRKIDHFEELVLAEVERLLKQKPLGNDAGPEGLTASDQIAAAEKLLAATLRFHDYARDHDLRRGKGWEPVRKGLTERLREVRLKQLQVAVGANDWARTREFGTKLLADYPQDPAVAQEVAAAWTGRAAALAKSSRDTDRIEARELLDLIEPKFPGGGGEAARKAREQLRQAAAELAANGEKEFEANNLDEARKLADRAFTLDPTAPGVSELRRKLNLSPPLNVAVRQFPERLTPLTARLDSERQAVELLFEGLLEEVPNDSGVRYRPGAAASLPTMVPDGRRLPLRLSPRGPGGRDGFDAHDVVGTVSLLRGRPELWAASGLPWLAELPAPEGGSVRISFRHGHPDPRALLTFKVLPAGWLLAQKDGPNNEEYRKKPFGTGPFRVLEAPKPAEGKPRELYFVPNDTYSVGGRDRKGQPFLKEIRMVEVTANSDPAADFRNGRLHILPDATPSELQRILDPTSGLTGRARVYTAGTNRRVHILAVNLRRPPLRSRDFRKGLAQAINREAVLAELEKQLRPVANKLQVRYTAPMTGPFPPKSWATVKGAGGVGAPLSSPDEGLNALRRYLAGPGAIAELTLLYPSEDPRAGLACEAIKAQVEALFKTEPNGKRLTLTLQPLPLAELFVWVMDEHKYDLAYVPFDYPDDWYPFGLAALLDPAAAGKGGRNFIGFRLPATNPDEQEIQLGQWLEELRGHGDFAGKIVPETARIHERFNEVMPFIPLWQLDRYTVVSERVQVYVEDSPAPADPRVLNPTVLFHNAARWRLQ
ncbi:MAG TPA: ABC transporter substrate-binding protein [Gemmataceae bacterium]|nr:ABC transporter substrate-binding protein [Gemmataceae bacterium]